MQVISRFDGRHIKLKNVVYVSRLAPHRIIDLGFGSCCVPPMQIVYIAYDSMECIDILILICLSRRSIIIFQEPLVRYAIYSEVEILKIYIIESKIDT